MICDETSIHVFQTITLAICSWFFKAFYSFLTCWHEWIIHHISYKHNLFLLVVQYVYEFLNFREFRSEKCWISYRNQRYRWNKHNLLLVRYVYKFLNFWEFRSEKRSTSHTIQRYRNLREFSMSLVWNSDWKSRPCS